MKIIYKQIKDVSKIWVKKNWLVPRFPRFKFPRNKMSILGAVFAVYNLDLDLRNLTTWKCQQINGKMRNKLTHKYIWRLHTSPPQKIQQLDRESVKIWTLPTLPTLPTYQPGNWINIFITSHIQWQQNTHSFQVFTEHIPRQAIS